MTDTLREWVTGNYDYTVAKLDELLLQARVELGRGDPLVTDELVAAAELAAGLREQMPAPPAVEVVAAELDLGSFERSLLLLCLGYEIDGRFSRLEAECTVGLALQVLPDANWPAFDSASTVRRWELVRVEDGTPLVQARLRLGPDVRRLLIGGGIVRPGPLFDVPGPPVLVQPSEVRAVDELLARVRATAGAAQDLVVELHGADWEERLLVAQLYAAALGRQLARVDVRDLPAPAEELDGSLRHWDRNARLMPAVLLFESHGSGDPASDSARVRRAASLVTSPMVVSGEMGVTAGVTRRVVRHECEWPDAEERLEVWRAVEGAAQKDGRRRRGKAHERALATIAERYEMGSQTIVAAYAQAVEEEATTTEDGEQDGAPRARGRRGASAADHLKEALNLACRRRVRAALEHLADRVEIGSSVELVLPEQKAAEIDEIVSRIDSSYLVNVEWGMGFGRAQAVSALFVGPSGTGKTLAARSIARRTSLDLYRIDLSTTLSKYIGETEKNIREVFEAAETGGAILLFDEADALFGKRGEVKDSHDRFANIGVAFLLQKVEESRCPCLLTTNFRDALDPAFTRRLGAIVEFPFPDAGARRQIWEKAFAPGTPTQGLQPERLATLVVNGGTIRNIALRAAHLAAMGTGPVEMHHVLEATRRELRKNSRDLPVEEVAGWV